MSLEFTEYALAQAKDGKWPQVPPGAENATQTIAVGAASAQSNAFNGNTTLIVVSKIDADTRIAIGANPVAVTTGAGQTRFLKAGSEYAFRVNPGDKLAAILA